MVRLWGNVIAVRPRLVLTVFEGEMTAKGHGQVLVLDGSRQIDPDARPEACTLTLAIGPATQEARHVGVGDLLRCEAHPVPGSVRDTVADYYRVGTLRILARAGDPGTDRVPAPDPPRTDPPPTAAEAETTSRRPLREEQLSGNGSCVRCPYGAIAAVIHLTDPRDYRSGRWSRTALCLGPVDCGHYAPAPGRTSCA